MKILVSGDAGLNGSNFVHYAYGERPDWQDDLKERIEKGLG